MIRVNNRRLTSQERGSALIVSLLILLVMTIVGVTTLNSTMMQEKMAVNSHDMITTFQAAEAAIGHGIADASAVDAPFFITALDDYKKAISPPSKTYDLDNGATSASAELTGYPPALVDGSGNVTPRNKMHHINSSMGVFVAYSMQFKGTGKINATGAKAVNVQGIMKGPYPAK